MNKKHSLVIGILLLINIIFYHELVFTNNTFVQRDIMVQFKPWKVFTKSVIQKVLKTNTNYLDFIPLWNPYSHCGTPFVANLQSQVFYPFNIIFILTNFVVGYKIFILLHSFLASLFMYIYLKSKKLNSVACIAGSIVWSFNGYMVTRTEFLSVFATIIWLPLITYLIDEYCIEGIKVNSILFLAITIALQFLSGHGQMWSYSLLFVLLYTLYLSIQYKNLSVLINFVVACFISILISAVQFIPTLEFLFLSTRAGENIFQFGLKFVDSAIFSLEYKDLTNFIYPFYWIFDTKKFSLPNYWLFTFYIGLGGIFLLILGFFSIKLKEKIFYLITILLVIMFSLGKNFFFYKILYSFFPFIRIFRYPSTAIYITIFIFSVLTGYGANFLVEHFKYKEKNYLSNLPELLIVFIFIELFSLSKKVLFTLPSNILDYVGENTSFLISCSNNIFRFALTPVTQLIGWTTRAKNVYDAMTKFRDKFLGNINMEYQLYNFRGQDIELKNFYRFMNFVYSKQTLDDAIPFFSIANVKYILSLLEQNTKLVKIIKFNELKIYENPFVLPRIYFVTQFIVENDLKKSLNIIDSLKEKVYSTIVLHEKVNFVNNINHSLKEQDYFISNTNFSTNKISFSILNKVPGFIVVSQNYYPGWKCRVDNKLTKIYHCNIFMSSIYIPEGYHDILLSYEPESFKFGCVITLLSLLSICIYFLEIKTS